MENTTNKYSSRGAVYLARGDKYAPKITFSSSPTYHEMIVKASRSGKRKMPPTLLPRYGTYAEYDIKRMNMLCKGISGSMEAWRPYSNTSFIEVEPTMIENPYLGADRSSLLGIDDLSPLIQNKIREEIISAKAQLAVDLIELRKTKKMLFNAAQTLLAGYRDIRAGQPFRTFVKTMNKDGFGSLAGKKWLEFIYGWAPSVKSSFEVAEILAKEFNKGLTITGRVNAKQRVDKSRVLPYGYEDVTCILKARGFYEFTVQDPKLLQLSQLGFQNPLSVAWEVMPWSFVLDWFVDVGGYINRMDFALGLSNVYWQYSARRFSYANITYTSTPNVAKLDTQPCMAMATRLTYKRSTPSGVVLNSFKGLKPFTNETVRLTSAVALVNQQVKRLKSVR